MAPPPPPPTTTTTSSSPMLALSLNIFHPDHTQSHIHSPTTDFISVPIFLATTSNPTPSPSSPASITIENLRHSIQELRSTTNKFLTNLIDSNDFKTLESVKERHHLNNLQNQLDEHHLNNPSRSRSSSNSFVNQEDLQINNNTIVDSDDDDDQEDDTNNNLYMPLSNGR